MITYNELYEALRKERYSEQLQPIPKNFIKEVAAYLKDKKEIAEKKDDDFSETILKTKKQFENMLKIEKECFDGIMKYLEKEDKKIAELLKGADEEERKKQKMIVFIEDTEEFLDLDGNTIGPFKKGDLVNIQEEIANILVIDKKAESVED